MGLAHEIAGADRDEVVKVALEGFLAAVDRE